MRTKRKATALTIASAIMAMTTSAGLLSGCPGTLDDPDRFKGCTDTPALLVAKCTKPGCHSDASPAAKLDLKSPGVESRVAGQPATFCVGGLLANPADPESSVLYRKLTDAPPCGAAMPLGDTAFTDLQLDCVLDWIGTLEAAPVPDAGPDDAADATD
jgi:hypothetical protein